MVRKIFLVVACFFLHLMSAGMSLSFGVLYREMRIDFGSSHSEAAWIVSIYNGLLGLVGTPLSFIANKIGEKWPAVFGSVLLSLGMLSSMFATKISIVYVTYGLLAGLGAGTTHYCGYTVLTAHFDNRWRPVATTVASVGSPLSALILPPVLTILIEQFDWRKAFIFLSCLSLLGIPASLSFSSPKQQTDSGSESSTGQQNSRTLSLSRCVKNLNYMLYFLASGVIFLVVYAPATFLPDLMHEFGRSSSDVYICVMTMGACDVVGRLLSGFLVHKMPKRLALIHSAGIMILCVSSGVIVLSRSMGTFVVMSAFLGFGSGCYAGLHFVMSTHLLPVVDVRFGYGIVITFGGLSLVAGMPLAETRRVKHYPRRILLTHLGIIAGSLICLGIPLQVWTTSDSTVQLRTCSAAVFENSKTTLGYFACLTGLPGLVSVVLYIYLHVHINLRSRKALQLEKKDVELPAINTICSKEDTAKQVGVAESSLENHASTAEANVTSAVFTIYQERLTINRKENKRKAFITQEKALKTLAIFLLVNTSLDIQYLFIWLVFYIWPHLPGMNYIHAFSFVLLYFNTSLNMFVVVKRYPIIRESVFGMLRDWKAAATCQRCQVHD